MKRAATFSRRLALIISLLYMLMIIPHMASITTDHFSHAIFLGALITAVIWLPLLAIDRFLDPRKVALSLAISFGILSFIITYFIALFALA